MAPSMMTIRRFSVSMSKSVLDMASFILIRVRFVQKTVRFVYTKNVKSFIYNRSMSSFPRKNIFLLPTSTLTDNPVSRQGAKNAKIAKSRRFSQRSFVFIDILALFRQFWSAEAKLPASVAGTDRARPSQKRPLPS
jgi:hypothetical protein